MKIAEFKYCCHKCKLEFRAPGTVAGMPYGELLLRNKETGNLRWVNASSDQVFSQVAVLVDRYIRDTDLSLNDSEHSDVVQRVFGYACDPDIDGRPFLLGTNPRCPKRDGG